MKNTIANLIAVLALLFSHMVVAAVEPGSDYKLVEPAHPADGSQIEVVDFFSYACSHCFHLHQSMAQWSSAVPGDVRLTHLPVIFNSSWESMARMYHTLQSLGQADALHDEIYKEVHVRHLDLANQLSTKPSRLDFMQLLGVDPDKFTATYDSPDIERKLAEARKLQDHYQLRGTPTLVVDGKYMITGLTPDRTVQVLQEVIELARKSRAVAMPKAAVLAAAPVVAPPAAEPQPSPRLPAPRKQTKQPKVKQSRAMDLDLRHCLELESNAAIAKCAGE
ncbi:MAG: thiol:disulfide interchange protein DsbA/DsbL [Gammaproteobacteria bacterium]|nr:thiol:disulfide interchange protein DsbA/DsbL [Gammaproteobacteria bacterium]MBU1775273.1 thiol:disulfide interchange protein DsbA/DsbL [Gammaproteobacteria bacterium]